MDIEIEKNVLNWKPILKPFPVPNESDKIPFGFIENEQWGIAYKMKEKEEVKHCMLLLRDKHLYSTSILNQIITKAVANKSHFRRTYKVYFIYD